MIMKVELEEETVRVVDRICQDSIGTEHAFKFGQVLDVAIIALTGHPEYLIGYVELKKRLRENKSQLYKDLEELKSKLEEHYKGLPKGETEILTDDGGKPTKFTYNCGVMEPNPQWAEGTGEK